MEYTRLTSETKCVSPHVACFDIVLDFGRKGAHARISLIRLSERSALTTKLTGTFRLPLFWRRRLGEGDSCAFPRQQSKLTFVVPLGAWLCARSTFRGGMS